MCGITGIIAKHEKIREEIVPLVHRMNDAILHRGPDGDGYFHDDTCALAMHRLSIIDIDSGQQPISNETNEVLIFFNGEIYNHLALKKDLIQAGHTFSTNSDTEVLVHLYEEYGEAMFSHINGMYAFCIYDKPNRKYLLARDSYGEKPLFYAHNNELFAFSSEINSLLEYQGISRQLDMEALQYFLRTSLIPEPLTLFKEVKTLGAGQYISIQKGAIDVKNHFNIEYKPDPQIKRIEDAKDLIKPLLFNAVKNQSISDVPIGCFLSGGIDSSTMVALLQKQSSIPIKTFNVRFEDEEYDESPIARAVAKHCGTDHYEVVVANEEFTEDIFWEIIDHMGQPFRDSSAIPTYQISKRIKKHVKVAISGDGGDEIFGGYDLFQWYTKILSLKTIPIALRQAVTKALPFLQKSSLFAKSSKLRQLNRVFLAAELSDENIAISLNEMFTPLEITLIMGDDFKTQAQSDPSLLCVYPEEAEHWSALRKIMYYRTRHTLPANMLVKVDRMSMANSLEVRSPFLDKDLSIAAAKLPDQFLIRNGKGKHIIREIMKEELPLEVFDHPKKGFNIPLQKYQNDTFRALAIRLLFDENPLPGLFKKSELEKIYQQGLNTKQDNSSLSIFRASHQLWMIMQFYGWAERFKVTLN
jgi:asparagine synthase (glutamine-hydrolysing)